MKEYFLRDNCTFLIECYTHGDYYDYSRIQAKRLDTGELFWMWRQPFDKMGLKPGDKFLLVDGIRIQKVKEIDIEI